MIKQFYEKALPTQGVFCVASIAGDGRVSQRFAETLDDLVSQIERYKAKGLNVYVAPASFEGYSRKAVDAVAVRSFFIDLDVGEGKGYADKILAMAGLESFISQQELPPPVVLDSGTGIHAYWLFENNVAAAEWKPYAEKFKAKCIASGLRIDPVVTADIARIMRCPDTLNYKTSPPSPSKILTEDIYQYSFEEFKTYLDGGVVGQATELNNAELVPVELSDVKDILMAAAGSLDADTLAILKKDNFERMFAHLATRSLEGEGCNQVRYILENAESLPEPLWYAGLGLARRCEDWEEAIHLMSEDYKNYNRDYTIKKAEQAIKGATGPHRCEKFNDLNPGICNDCPYNGKISTPLQLAEQLRPVTAEETKDTANSVGSQPNTKTLPLAPLFPKSLFPFMRGINGGVYYQPPPTKGKGGKSTQEDPVLLIATDLFPVKRLYSEQNGECLLMAHITPRDPYMEFLLPMKDTYSMETFKKIMAAHRVLAPASAVQHLMNYVIKWGQYLLTTTPAEQMRMQMGWTENHEYFVVGNIEIAQDGTERKAPASPFVRGIAKLLTPTGSAEAWRAAADKLDRPEFNMHAFGMLCGLGSPLMCYTSTSGISVSYTGPSGGAKTGALYAGLSLYGNPKELSVFDATDNGMIGRYLGLHNLLLGCDEVTNKDFKLLSQLIHRISHGKAKIRMQASVNAEREYEMFASMIGFFTCNEPIYDKLQTEKSNPGGEIARLVEFLIPKSPLLENDSKIGRDIFDTFRTNYGFAGPAFIKALFKVSDTDREQMLGDWTAKFMEAFGQDSSYRFYENLIAATFTAGEIAVKAGIITLDLDRVFKHVVGEMIKIRDKTVKFTVTDYEALIGEYLGEHHTGLLVLNDGKVLVEPRNALIGRVEVHNQISYISKTSFKVFLAERHISSREFEHALAGRKLLVDCPKQRLSTGWRAGMTTPPIAVYGFKSEIPVEILTSATE